MNEKRRPEAPSQTPAKKPTTRVDEIAPGVANREALRRRLERIAVEADRRGDVETAAVARWLGAA